MEVSVHSTCKETSGVRERETETGQWKPGQGGNPSGKRMTMVSSHSWLSIAPCQLTLCGLDVASGIPNSPMAVPTAGPQAQPHSSTVSALGPGTCWCWEDTTSRWAIGYLWLCHNLWPYWWSTFKTILGFISSLLSVFHLGALPFLPLLPVMFHCL